MEEMSFVNVRGVNKEVCLDRKGYPEPLNLLILEKVKKFFSEDAELIEFMKRTRKKTLFGRYDVENVFGVDEKCIIRVMFPDVDLAVMEEFILDNIATLLNINISVEDGLWGIDHNLELSELKK